MRLYALLDRKQQEYGMIVRAQNDEVAKRNLLDGLSELKGTPLDKYPEDFDLMCLGNWDPSSGIIEPNRVPRFVGNVGILRDAVSIRAGVSVPNAHIGVVPNEKEA